MNVKQEFSKRLKEAMRAAGYEDRATVLERNFNTRYSGKSISVQSAWRWLAGRSIPEQDKLQVLADWLEVEPHVLRFGSSPIQNPKKPREPLDGKMEREVLELFSSLSSRQKKALRVLIMELAKQK
jgi:hypothetical protein